MYACCGSFVLLCVVYLIIKLSPIIEFLMLIFSQTWQTITTYIKTIWNFFFLNCILYTSYFGFSIAVLSHSPGVVYYHLLLRRETSIPEVAPFSFQIGIWDLFVHRGQKFYTHTAFGKLWTTPGERCIIMPHHNP